MGGGSGMKTTERLFARVEGLWREALEKPFVVEMADGTLSAERFRYYMVQDALYIGDYIGILELIRRKVGELEREPVQRMGDAGAGGPGFVRAAREGFDGGATGAGNAHGRDEARPSQEAGWERAFDAGRDWKSHLPEAQHSQNGHTDLGIFLDGIIAATKEEQGRVHRTNLEKLGISDEMFERCERSEENAEYVAFLRGRVEKEGVVAGLVALLHCSWMYAFIAETMVARMGAAIARSPYRGWFEEYAGAAYETANRRWIEVVDRETSEMGETELERLGDIFVVCARHENRFWDMAYAAVG